MTGLLHAREAGGSARRLCCFGSRRGLVTEAGRPKFPLLGTTHSSDLVGDGTESCWAASNGAEHFIDGISGKSPEASRSCQSDPTLQMRPPGHKR